MSIRSLGAKHTWHSADGQEFVLGDVIKRPTVLIRDIKGRHSKPDMEDNRDPRPGATGEIPRLSALRGKTESWEIALDCESLAELAEKRSEFVNAFADPREGTMTIASHQSYDDGPYEFKARCLAADVAGRPGLGQGSLPNRPWAQDAVLTLRLSDPRYYETYERVESTTLAPTTEGLVLPAALPAPVPGPVDAGGGLSVDAGEAPVDHVLELTGPTWTPIVYNESLGEQLTIKQFALQAGQLLTIDFRDRTVKVDGSSIREYIDWATSGWFDANVFGLQRGVNRLRYGGWAVSTGASMKVRFRRASFG